MILNKSFRLLMEYHSFLLEKKEVLGMMEGFDSFRLLMEYHSFLSEENIFGTNKDYSFRLLMEYHSFLFYSKFKLG